MLFVFEQLLVLGSSLVEERHTGLDGLYEYTMCIHIAIAKKEEGFESCLASLLRSSLILHVVCPSVSLLLSYCSAIVTGDTVLAANSGDLERNYVTWRWSSESLVFLA